MIRIFPLQTGWVKVKRAHQNFRGPEFFRLPSIMTDFRWTPWLPILCWLIDHPEGPILVDTGEHARISEPEFTKQDPVNSWIIRKLLKFDVSLDSNLEMALHRIGFKPDQIKHVILTHVHSDHTGGLSSVPKATIWMNSVEHQNALTHPKGTFPFHWPKSLQIKYPEMSQNDSFFGLSATLTSDSNIRIVNTPGHSEGHQSVVVTIDDLNYFLAGDVSFTEQQVKTMCIPGISENFRKVKDTYSQIDRFACAHKTVYLPTHDLESLKRFYNKTLYAD